MNRSKLAHLLMATVALAGAAGESRGATETVLGSFDGTAASGHFFNPGNVTLAGSTLYGVTEWGGANGEGTIFSVPATGGPITTLYTFDGTKGADPTGNLTLSADGTTLFGTTSSGGSGNTGTIFSFPVAGGTPTLLSSTIGGGGGPNAGLTLSADGTKLYMQGATGGSYGGIISIPVTGGTPAVLGQFNHTDGVASSDQLTLSPNGLTLYGMSHSAGASNGGTVFSMPVTGGTPTLLGSFNATSGENPFGSVTLSADGLTLYGMTSDGLGQFGSIFSLPVGGGTPTVLSVISQSEGNLTLVGSTLYGMTGGGGSSNGGTVFTISPGGTPTTLLSFTGANGSLPAGSFTLSGSTLYATTYLGGLHSDGAIIALTLPEPSSVVLLCLGTIGLAAMTLRRKTRKQAA
jgi:uncharacterized repeat protein (TIGR03803 family)